MQSKKPKQKFQINSGKKPLEKGLKDSDLKTDIKKKSESQNQSPEITKEQMRAFQEMEMEMARLQNSGYHRFQEMVLGEEFKQILQDINKNLNGIGTILSRIGETIDSGSNEESSDEDEEQDEDSEDSEDDEDNEEDVEDEEQDEDEEEEDEDVRI
jgi:hypothetical protein